MKPRRTNSLRAAGFTLVELMVALGLSALVSAVVVTLYVEIGKNFRFDERYAAMQENGRFALQMISNDLTMAEFWGRVVSTDTITTTLTPAASSCADAIDVFDSADSLLFNDYHPTTPVLQFTPCASVLNVHKANTSMLVVKRVEGQATAEAFVDTADTDGDGDITDTITNGTSDLELGEVYLRTNGTAGSLIDTAGPLAGPPVGESDWRYIPRLYFIRTFFDIAADAIPSLCRLQLEDDKFDDLQCLAEGIEDFQIMFGIDTDTDGYANVYLSQPTPAQMKTLVTARIFLLARTRDADPFYVNDKTYQLGDATLGPFNDGFYRRVYTSTVLLRNAVSKILID